MNDRRFGWWVTAAALMLALVGSAGFAANTITVTGAAAIHGSFGMSTNLDASSNNVYVEDQSPNAEPDYVIDFWASKGTLVYPLNNSVRIGVVNTTGGGQHLIFFFKKNPNNTVHLNTWYLNDTGAFNFGCTIFHSNAPSAIARQYHIVYNASSAPGADDGSIDIRRVDNGNGCTITGLDNDTKLVDAIRWGALAGSGANATGSWYFDDFVSTRQ